MSDLMERLDQNDPQESNFTVDGEYLLSQVLEAMILFLTPLSGVYRAAIGNGLRRKARGAKRPKLARLKVRR